VEGAVLQHDLDESGHSYIVLAILSEKVKSGTGQSESKESKESAHLALEHKVGLNIDDV